MNSISNGLPRGLVTFVFTDIEGSTRMVQHLDVRYADVLEEHRHIVQEAVNNWNGYVVDSQGDAFFLAFHRAADAVAAVVQIQRTITEHRWPGGGELRVRIGVHTGEPTVAANRYIGLDVHRAARLCSASHGGQVLISESTRHRVADEIPAGARLHDLGEHRLKDFPRPERIWQLVVPDLPSQFPPLRTTGARFDNLPVPATPFIGRQAEVDRLGAELKRPMCVC